MDFKTGLGIGRRIRAAAWAAATVAATAGLAQGQETSFSQIDLTDDLKDRIVIRPGVIWTMKFGNIFSDVAIGDLDVIDVFPLTDTSIYLQSKAVGLTNLVLFDENQEYLGEVEVQVAIDSPEPKLQMLINDAVPGANVAVNMVNNRIYLKGRVTHPSDVDVVLKIAESYGVSEQPVVYSLAYPAENNSTATVNVLRKGGKATSYSIPTPSKAQEVDVVVYGTSTQGGRTTDEAEGEDDRRIEINVNTGATPSSES